MAKIPLEKTIGGAYRFLFSNIVSVVGIVWLPYLVFGGIAAACVAYWLKLHPISSMNFDAAHFDPAPFVALGQIVPVITICLLLAALMTTVGLTRKALGLMEGTTFVYFSLGAAAWRLLGASLLIVLIYIGTIVLFVVVAVVWALFGQKFLPHGAAMLVDVLGIIAMVLWLIYMMVRLTFFVPAVVVAEETIGIGRSWQLGAGNFWRIFLTFFMVALPPLIVFGMVNSIVSTSLYGAMPIPTFIGNPHPDPQQVLNFYKQILTRMGPLMLALQFVYVVIARALYAGAVATAYRGVTATDSAPAA